MDIRDAVAAVIGSASGLGMVTIKQLLDDETQVVVQDIKMTM